MKFTIQTYKGVSINQKGLLIKVIKQINKDLLLAGFETIFDENNSIEILLNEFVLWLDFSIFNEKAKFLSFLYRVDINEDVVLNQHIFRANQIALKIIEREFKKVVLKAYFKE